MASGSAADEDSRLDTFDGSDPAAYRLWRRAKIMLAALPSTISSTKYGARLMKHIQGEDGIGRISAGSIGGGCPGEGGR